MKIRGVLFYFPICILFIGVIIHTCSLLNAVNKEIYTLWNIWVDASMLIIDASAFYGLLANRKWGYYEALAVFIVLGIVQFFLGVFYFAKWGNMPFEIQNLAALIAYAIAAICLKINNYRFVSSSLES